MSWRFISTARFMWCWLFLAWAGFCSVGVANASPTAYQAYWASTAPNWELLPAANSAYGTVEGLGVTRVEQVAPRMGWPAANVSQTARMEASAVRTAGTFLARSAGPLALALVAGAALDWWLDDSGHLVKPAAGPSGQQPIPATGSYYRYCRNGGCIWASSATSPDAIGAACAAGLLCGWPGQTVESYHCWGNITSSVACEFSYKQGNDGPYSWEPGFGVDMQYSDPNICPGGMSTQGGMCSPSSSVVSDSEIGDAVESWAGSNAEAVRDWLKANGKWSPTQFAYDPAEQVVKSDPKTETTTTVAPNGQPQTATKQTRDVTQVKCTADGCAVTAGKEVTQTNPDGSTSTQTQMSPEAQPNTSPTSQPSPNPTEIPDDYARQQTLQDVLNTLQNRQASGSNSCDSPPSCSGDPINCQMLMELFRSRCVREQPPEDTIESDEINVDTLVGSLSRTRYSAGLTCPPDIVVPTGVVGNVTIPMQPACNQAALIRPVVIALGVIVAAFIVMGAKEA